MLRKPLLIQRAAHGEVGNGFLITDARSGRPQENITSQLQAPVMPITSRISNSQPRLQTQISIFQKPVRRQPLPLGRLNFMSSLDLGLPTTEAKVGVSASLASMTASHPSASAFASWVPPAVPAPPSKLPDLSAVSGKKGNPTSQLDLGLPTTEAKVGVSASLASMTASHPSASAFASWVPPAVPAPPSKLPDLSAVSGKKGNPASQLDLGLPTTEAKVPLPGVKQENLVTAEIGCQTLPFSCLACGHVVDYISKKYKELDIQRLAAAMTKPQWDFISKKSNDDLIRKLLTGNFEFESVYITPSMEVVPPSTELRGALQKKGSWPFYFAKGMRPLDKKTLSHLRGLMTSHNSFTVLFYLLTYVGVIMYPEGCYITFTDEVYSKLGKLFPLPESYTGSVQTTTGPKTFICPLCEKVVMGRNAKQHLVTLMCNKSSPIDAEQRRNLAHAITAQNLFLIKNEHLDRLNAHLKKQDRTFLRGLLMLLGGQILDKEFKPMHLNDCV
ncbi:uncharacterized protein LOC117644858 [Thrips palmi]|uniref:Uncharacterized protein LOC117644858 n=1 Tax=Thrips palmi TaxID=161013 RepID=A0A6P8Z1F4_THRPL|nr:uncharacterized protein LOC117644858 [Thrips palmi]